MADEQQWPVRIVDFVPAVFQIPQKYLGFVSQIGDCVADDT